jgi:hypothetical protein
MIRDDSGNSYSRLAADRVLRSVDAAGTVSDYIQVNPGQIASLVPSSSDEVKGISAGVDDHRVMGDALTKQDADLVPSTLPVILPSSVG